MAGRVWSFRDTTQLVRAEESLKASEEKYRILVEKSTDIIFSFNAASEFIYVSPSIKNVLGYSPEDISGQSLDSLIHPEDLLGLQQAIQRNIKNGSQTLGGNLIRVRNVSGDWRWHNTSGNAVYDGDGNFQYFLAISRDITAQKEAEKEKQSIEAKAQVASRLAAIGEMAAGIAHEINNPLTGVIGFSELVLDNPGLPKDIKENVQIIADNAKRVGDIVKRLLTFARQAKPVKVSVNLNELIDNTLKLREYVLKTNNIIVVTRFDQDLPLSVIDPGQMQQVFLNLIVNAEQAMKGAHGKGILTITTEKQADGFRICFQDDGPGIKTENMGRIFEPFFTTKEVGEGTGLGLSLSRSILLEHGGSMSVESDFGHGATFILELPLREPAQPKDAAQMSQSKEIPAVNKKGRILVVDDEIGVRELLKKVMKEMGHSVDVISDAGSAMELIDAGTMYDLILADIRMPGMNGVELCTLILRKMPEMKNKIIVITGDIIGADIKEFLKLNKLEYLAKPFDIKRLKEKIDAVISLSG
jgi:PAS domain S-box-containing protein